MNCGHILVLVLEIPECIVAKQRRDPAWRGRNLCHDMKLLEADVQRWGGEDRWKAWRNRRPITVFRWKTLWITQGSVECKKKVTQASFSLLSTTTESMMFRIIHIYKISCKSIAPHTHIRSTPEWTTS